VNPGELAQSRELSGSLEDPLAERSRPQLLGQAIHRDGHSTTGRFGHYFIQAFCHGDESCLHSAFPYKLSTDLMWLAGRLRAAAAKGDVTKIDVPEDR
jgi:hypothetical protein